jgi:hypothetical protein
MPRALSTLEEHEGVLALEHLIVADANDFDGSDPLRVRSIAAVREMYEMFHKSKNKNMPQLKDVTFQLKYSFSTFASLYPPTVPSVQLYFTKISYISPQHHNSEEIVDALQRCRCNDVFFCVDDATSLRTVRLLCVENRITRLRLQINTATDWTDDVVQAMSKNTSIAVFNFKLYSSGLQLTCNWKFDFLKLMKHLPKNVEVMSMSHEASFHAAFNPVSHYALFAELARYRRLWFLCIKKFPFDFSNQESTILPALSVKELELENWSFNFTPEILQRIISACPKLYTVVLKGAYDYDVLGNVIETTARARDIDYHLDVAKSNISYELNKRLLATKNIYYTN